MGVCWLSEGCLKGVWKVPGGNLWDVEMVKPGQVKSGQVKSEQVKSVQVKSGHVESDQFFGTNIVLDSKIF